MSEQTGNHNSFDYTDEDDIKPARYIDHRKPNQWHLDKTFSISHIFSTVAIVIGLFTWGSKMDNRVSIVEVEQAHLIIDGKKDNELLKDNFREMQAALLRIENKLDTKVDKK